MPLTFEQIKEFITEENGFHKPSGENYRLYSVSADVEDIVLHFTQTIQGAKCTLKVIRKLAKNPSIISYCNDHNWKRSPRDVNKEVSEWVYNNDSYNICVEDTTALRNELDFITAAFTPIINELRGQINKTKFQSPKGIDELDEWKKEKFSSLDNQNSSNDNRTQPTIGAVIKFNEQLLKGTNPDWLMHKKIFVLPGEEEAVQNYNKRCTKLNHVITLGYPFEAVVGNPLTADIIVVSHNPYTSTDRLTKTVFNELDWNNDDVNKHRWMCYEQQYEFFLKPNKFDSFPAYNLDPKFKGVQRGEGPYGYWGPKFLSPTGIIWQAFKQKGYSRTKDWNEIVNWSANHIAFVELFGYHSATFDSRDLSKFEHTQAILQFIENAIESEKLLFFRSQKTLNEIWLQRFSELNNCKLEDYIKKGEHVFCPATPGRARPSFTTGNIMHARYIIEPKDKTDEDLKAEACDMAIEYLKSKIEEKH